MKKVFDENGIEISGDELALTMLEAANEVRKKNDNELLNQVKNFVNRNDDCSDDEAKMLIKFIRNHKNYDIFK